MKRIGIIGEGKMGTNIFNYLGSFEYDLTWVVSHDANINDLEKTFQKKILRSLKSEMITEERYDRLFSYTLITTDLSKVSDCDLVIEAVSENLKIKQIIFGQLDQYVSPECILATNSSSMLPSEILDSEERKYRSVGLHFFYPVALKNIVEFIRLPETSENTVKAVSSFLKNINRKFITLYPDNSFLLNRIFLDLQVEAYSVVNEGTATFEQVDNFIKMYITPSGVFEFCDHVGNDIMLTAVMNYTRRESEKEKYLPFMLKLDELVKAGRLGKKTGNGFFAYSKNEIVKKNPTKEPDPAAVRRIHLSLDQSIEKFARRSGIEEEKIRELLKEYF